MENQQFRFIKIMPEIYISIHFTVEDTKLNDVFFKAQNKTESIMKKQKLKKLLKFSCQLINWTEKMSIFLLI